MKNYSPLTWITIGSIVLAGICLFIMLKSCEHVDKGTIKYSKQYVDSINRGSEEREKLAKFKNDSLQAEAEYNQSLADSFYMLASSAQDRADKYHTSFNSARAKYDELKKSSKDTITTKACDESLAWADSTIHEKDHIIHLQDSVISKDSKVIISLSRQVEVNKQLAAGFKSDFMNLKNNVIPPLQNDLKHANAQWKANRAGKKIGWGVAAAAIIFSLLKK